MTLYYDYVNRKARAEVEAGYEAAKYYIRRYDSENEYMVRLPPIDDCKRSFLGEEMPYPDLSEAHFVKEVVIDGVRCNYFLHLEYDIRVHIYMAVDDNAPVRLIQESVEENGTSIPLLTYDYSDVIIGEPEAEWFELPEPYEHKTCTRHIGGFPYLHIFHYFVKFWKSIMLNKYMINFTSTTNFHYKQKDYWAINNIHLNIAWSIATNTQQHVSSIVARW